MKSHVFDMSDLPRIGSLYPQVLRVGCQEDVRFLRSRRMNDWQLSFQLFGTDPSSEIIINGKKYQADFPRVLIKRPGELHQTSGKGLVSSFYFVYSSDSPFQQSIPENLVLFHLDFSDRFQLLFNRFQIFTEHLQEFGVSDRIDALCYAFMQEVILAFVFCQNPLSEMDGNIRKVMSYMRMHFNDGIDMEKLAHRFSYSLRSLNRHWKQSRQDSPGEYLMNLRMAEARRILLETDLTINEISQKMHYSQSAYFIRAFRRYYGMTPHQYRLHQ